MNEVSGIAVFDFDGTMIKGDSLVRFLLFAQKKKKVSLSHLLYAACLGICNKLGLISDSQAKTKAFSFLSKMNALEIDLLTSEFVETLLLPNLFQDALDKLLFHRGCGHTVIIISASPDFYMKHLKRFLPVNDVLASTSSAHGQITQNIKGREKVVALQNWLENNNFNPDMKNSYSYGNSSTDIPVMSLAKYPVFINSRKSARKKQPNWQSLHWK